MVTNQLLYEDLSKTEEKIRIFESHFRKSDTEIAANANRAKGYYKKTRIVDPNYIGNIH